MSGPDSARDPKSNGPNAVMDLVCIIWIFLFLRWLPKNSSIAGMFSYKVIFLFVIIFLLSTFSLTYCLYVNLIPCRYQVVVLVCNILVIFLFLQTIYVNLYNVYLSNL